MEIIAWPFLKDGNRVGTNFSKNHFEDSIENYFLKNFVESLYDFFSEQNKELKLMNKMEFPMLKEKDSIYASDIAIESDYFNRNIFNLNGNGELFKNDYMANRIVDKLHLISSNSSNLLSIPNQGKKAICLKGEKNLKGGNLTSTLPSNIRETNVSFKLENSYSNYSQDRLFSEALNHNDNLKIYRTSEKNENNLKIKEIKNCNKLKNSINNKYSTIKIGENVKNMLELINNADNITLNPLNGLIKYENLPEFENDIPCISIREEEKYISIINNKSPNPFEDYNFEPNSNIFNSPNPLEKMMNKLQNENNNEKSKISFDLNRNSSIDYNEIFKTTTPNKIEKNFPKENKLLFDDSFFSISPNDKKTEAISDIIFN